MESEHDFTAFLDGEVISLKEVGDGVFSEGIVGEGLAIRTNKNGVETFVFHTGMTGKAGETVIASF